MPSKSRKERDLEMHGVGQDGLEVTQNGKTPQTASPVKIAGLPRQTIKEGDGPTDASSPLCSKIA
jgi:hypothetical protein